METGTIAIPKTSSTGGDAIFVYIENNSAIFAFEKRRISEGKVHFN